MEDKIKSFKEVCEICHKLQKEGKKIVFVHGFFDILHRGHAMLFQEAKKFGDILVVGVDADKNAKMFKGYKRPVNELESRFYVLSQLISINYIFEIPSFLSSELADGELLKIYKSLMPDVIATNSKTDKYSSYKQKRADIINAEFIDIEASYYSQSTTSIIETLSLH